MPKNKDGYFRSTFVVGYVDGKPKRITVRAKTKKELDFKLAEAKRRYGRGASLEDITVSDWAERWLRIYKANVSDSQKRHYSAKLENDILPFIGHFPIRDIRASHLQEILNFFDGGRVGTVQKIKITIKQLFLDAQIEGLIDRNPSIKLELPDLVEATRRPLTLFERLIVFEVAKTHGCGAYVLTMLLCGLRRGECIALRVGNIDFQKLTIHVALSLSFDRGNKGTEKDPKSKAGTRNVPIPAILLPFLEAKCQDKEPDDILFPKADGKHATRQTCVWWWKSFKRQCHLLAGAKVYRNQVQVETSPFSDEITPHYLRHTYATDLYAAGVDDKAQKSFLGHSSSDVTDIYRKMNEAAFTRALTQINEYNSLIYS